MQNPVELTGVQQLGERSTVLLRVRGAHHRVSRVCILAGVVQRGDHLRQPGHKPAVGELLAALSISGPIERLGRSPGSRFAPVLVAGARRISAELAG